MDESILNTVKKLLGIDPEYDSFDKDIVVFTNTAFGILNQLGVGPEEGFSISGDNETWNDYISDDMVGLDMVRTYVVQKVRLMFDPPQSSAVIEAVKSHIAELEWRLLVQYNPHKMVEEN